MLGGGQALLLSVALLMALVAVAPEEAPNQASRGSVGAALFAAVCLFVGLVI